jgi:multidrug resistance efflux pump
MRASRLLSAFLTVLLLPWYALRFFLHVLHGLLLSVRFWVLFLLALIAVLVAYYAFSDRYTPFTTDAYVQAYVVQVAARVEGQVVRVYVDENQTVRKGELLFEIDPRPFEHKLAQLEAKLAFTTQQVEQMQSELQLSKAEEARSAAEESYAEAVFKQEAEIYKQDATTNRRYIDAVQKYKAAQALRDKTRAAARKAEQALAARVGSEHALVAEVRAQIAEAKLDLEWTKVYAPCNGYVTNLQLREGAYAHVGKPVLTCIDTDRWWVVANYRENSLENIRPGQPVGLTLNSYPGRVFAGTVQSVGWGVSEGQGVPSGELPAVRNPKEWIRVAQRFQVRVAPELPPEHPLRVGATATVTVYTGEDGRLVPVARAWQQLVAWFDYLY